MVTFPFGHFTPLKKEQRVYNKKNTQKNADVGFRHCFSSYTTFCRLMYEYSDIDTVCQDKERKHDCAMCDECITCPFTKSSVHVTSDIPCIYIPCVVGYVFL